MRRRRQRRRKVGEEEEEDGGEGVVSDLQDSHRYLLGDPLDEPLLWVVFVVQVLVRV